MAYGIYIHLPFCKKKCNYCDFLSFPCESELYEKYVSVLTEQIKKAPRCEVDSIFIGGGTPSVVDARLIFEILSAVYNTFTISEKCEISIEANPATVDKEKLEAYKSFGINRISVGVQSFNDDELKILGRLHDSTCAKKCLELVCNTFNNFNVDLMFAIPNQTLFSLRENIKTLLSYSPSHISSYSLIIEENTRFFEMYKNGEIGEVSEDVYLEMLNEIINSLSNFGYERYEISNFAKKGFECKHNLKYWCGGEYFGFGLGAVGFLENKRYENTLDFQSYLNGEDASVQILKTEDLISEYIITGLRKTKGFSLVDFEKRFNKSFFDLYDVSQFERLNLLKAENNSIRLTEKGLCVSNEIMCHFV